MDGNDFIDKGVPCAVVHFGKDGTVAQTGYYNTENIHVEDWQYESIASSILTDIQAYFETEEGQAEFKQWKAEREAQGIPPVSYTKTPRSSRRRKQ